jgi:hypothetical protein
MQSSNDGPKAVLMGAPNRLHGPATQTQGT